MDSLTPRRNTPPELLAPAGDADCARAAVENGADAVYFGLRGGLNARARAVNFAPEELPELMAMLHRRGVRGYVTLNTLVFPGEMEALEQSVRAAVAAGVDAALVQDLGAVRLIRELCPDWPLHASTQMALTSAEGIAVAARLGIRRVVLARELSLAEIRQIRAATDVELEVFVHGALCMSYSGQCMASFAMGGRSGNRGQCAQACRLPYELIYDGRRKELDGRRYLLSPLDLAAYDLVPELIDAGVAALKIEGRMKSAEYVAAVTALYRRAIDEAAAGRRLQLTTGQREEIEVAFSRGFSHGWLDGPRDGSLVPGHGSAHRGVLLGTVQHVRGDRVAVELAAAVQRGDGLAFDSSGESTQQGGRVYEVLLAGRSVTEPVAEGTVELTFGRDAMDFGQIRPGQKVWKTDDPRLFRRLRKTFDSADPQRRVPLDVTVEAAVGRRLVVAARATSGASCRVESTEPLEEARRHPLTVEVLREQLGRLGASVYQLRQLDARIDGRPMVPLSVLGQIRHEMLRRLDQSIVDRPPLAVGQTRSIATRSVSEAMEGRLACQPPDTDQSGLAYASGCDGRESGRTAPQWHILCRSLEQVETAIRHGLDLDSRLSLRESNETLAERKTTVTADECLPFFASLIADFASIDDYRQAVALGRQHHVPMFLATPRIHKPGETALLERIAATRPDGMLARNLAAVDFCRAAGVAMVADASLHAANPRSVACLHDLGAQRVTVAADLERPQLLELVEATPAEWLEVVIRAHLPMFHTEYCLRRALLGRCDECRGGRPTRGLRLRDRRGVEHPLRADAGCRNTLFHAEPRDLSALVPELTARGVRHFRIELLDA